MRLFNGRYGVIAGGQNNRVQSYAGVVSGGENNAAVGLAPFATVGGGSNNTADGQATTVGGGSGNRAVGDNATVAGGQDNTALVPWSTIAGGHNNNISGGSSYSSIAGGSDNGIGSNAPYSAIPGGRDNTVTGAYSLAAGRRAKANHQGVFVFADDTNADFASTANSRFLVRADRTGLRTNDPLFAMHLLAPNDVDGLLIDSATTNNELLITPSTVSAALSLNCIANQGFNLSANQGIAVNSGTSTQMLAGSTMTLGAGATMAVGAPTLTISAGTLVNGNIDIDDGVHIRGKHGVTGWGLLLDTDLAAKSSSSSWFIASDERLKKDIRPLAPSLDRLLTLEPVTFEYADPDHPLYAPGTHTGFIAQDAQRVFPNWVRTGPAGYLYMAPQGFEALTIGALRELRNEKDTQIARLRAENDELRARMERIERLLAAPPDSP